MTDSNRMFFSILILVLVVSLLFLLAPIFVVIVKGLGYVPAAAFSAEVRFSLLLSLRTTTESTVICMVVAVVAAYAMQQLSARLQKILFSLFSIPMSLPHLVSGAALLLVYGRLGIGDWLFRTTGIDFVYTRQGILLALVFVNLSYAVILLYSAVTNDIKRLEFTARTLGCSKFQAFRRVSVPLMFPQFFATAVMTWSRALGEFGAVIMLAGSTRMKTEILPTAVYLNMATGDLDMVLGISVMLILVSILCIILLQLCIPLIRKGRTAYAGC